MEEGVGEAGRENNLVDLVGLGDRGGGGRLQTRQKTTLRKYMAPINLN